MRTALIVSVFLASTAAVSADETCRLDPDAAPSVALTYPGIVRGPATPREVALQTAIALGRVHAPLSPRFANLPRVFVFYDDGGQRHGTIAAVTDGSSPAPGDRVVVASRWRDPASPCAFIPWTVKKGKPAETTS